MEEFTLDSWYMEKTFVDIQIDSMARYHSEMIGSLDQSLKEFEKRVADLADGEAKEVRDEIYEAYSDEYFEYKDDFPDIHRKSFFITIASYLENELKNICHKIEREYQIKSKYNEVEASSEFERFEIFFQDVGMQYNFGKDVWKRINNFRQARNDIVHCDSVLRPQLKPFVNKYGCDIKHNRIVLSDKIIDSFLSDIKNFLQELIDAAEKGPKEKGLEDLKAHFKR